MTAKRYDANSAVLERELNYVRSRVTDKFRPSKWASLLPVNTSVPAWVETVETQKITQYADFKQIQQDSTSFPKPTEDRSADVIRTVTMGAAYDVMDLELQKAEQTGINISAARPAANALKSEQILDYIAATGQLPDGFQIPGMRGLLNQTTGANNATLVVASTKGTAGTGTAIDWDTSTLFEEVLDDMHALLQGVESGSKENYKATDIVLPLSKLHYIQRKRESNNNTLTVYDAFLNETQGDVRVTSWEKCATAGAGGITRMCAFNRSPEVAEMLMLQTLTEQPPIRKAMGFEVVQWFKTGGVRSENPTGIAYMDGI